MYQLRVICPPETAEDVVTVLDGREGVGRITHHPAADTLSQRDLLQTEVADQAVQDLLRDIATTVGREDIEVFLRPVQDIEHYRFERGRAVAVDEDEGISISVGSRAFRRLIRIDYQYVLLTMAAAVVATAGMIGGLPIAVVGAMAFSPDLGRLNAMAFAVITREWRLLARGASSLAVGMLVAIASAATVTLLLSLGELTDPLATIPDLLVTFVTVLDGVTITVAIGSGVAAMVVFITDRGTAAVGVGVSITTIPAAVYAGIALADGDVASAGDALLVLAVNITCVVAAGVLTGLTLRSHFERRARSLPAAPAPSAESGNSYS